MIIKWKEKSSETLQAIVDAIGNDGHTIWEPTVLDKSGLTNSEVATLVKTYHSDGSRKGSIIKDDGSIAESMNGIYGLHVLESIVYGLGLGGTLRMGRGSWARDYTQSIKEHIAQAHLIAAKATVDGTENL